ncbi:hypothetical protein N2152v2_010038 [Parachlorella kessleri]
MLVRSTVRPWHGGSRVGLLQLKSAAPRPRSSLVLCSKAPREPSLHPRVRRLLEADPQLASLAKDNPHLLQSLSRSSGQVQGGRRQTPQKQMVTFAHLARAAYQLGLPVPPEQQRHIVSKFISLVTALQDRHAAQAKPGPLPPKSGWVQVKLSKQEPSAVASTGVAVECGGSHSHSNSSSSSSSSEQPLQGQPGMGELRSDPYVEEGGIAEILLDRVLPQLSSLKQRQCSDTLVRDGLAAELEPYRKD